MVLVIHGELHMARKVSNTLSRWHKVVGRMKAASEKLMAEISRGVGEVSYLDAVVLQAEQSAVMAETQKAVAKVDLLLKLNAAQEQVRVNLAVANVEHGVSEKLARQVRLQSEMGFYEHLVGAVGFSRIGLSEGLEVLKTRTGDRANRSIYDSAYSFARVSSSVVEGWKTRQEELGKELQRLADELSDVNATRLSVELDEEVLDYLGM